LIGIREFMNEIRYNITLQAFLSLDVDNNEFIKKDQVKKCLNYKIHP